MGMAPWQLIWIGYLVSSISRPWSSLSLVDMLGMVFTAHTQSGWLSMFLSCRQIYYELLPILYSRPKFAFHDMHAFSRIFSTEGRTSLSPTLALYKLGPNPYDPLVEWKNIWYTIRKLPRPLLELGAIITAMHGLHRPLFGLPADPDVYVKSYGAYKSRKMAPSSLKKLDIFYIY
jgi:hypothetical protein